MRGVAADMGASEFELLAQHLHQQRVGRRLNALRFAVDFELNLHRLNSVFKKQSFWGEEKKPEKLLLKHTAFWCLG